MRARTKRRAAQRIDTKEIRDIWRGLAGLGVADRIRKVNEAVAPGAPIFWHILKLRLAAREDRGPVTDIEAVRQLAVAVLAGEGHDLAGIVLKVTWRPPELFFEAGAEHGLARGVVQEVQATDRGKERARARAALR